MIYSDDQKGRDYIREILKEDVINVKFTKKDGSERSMNCTLKSGKIPFDKEPRGTVKTKRPEDSIAVFDVDADGWRSFRFDSVKEINFID